MGDVSPSGVELVATVLFAAALVHTFASSRFERLAQAHPTHRGLWHLLGEVEVVFGFWAMVMLVFFAAWATPAEALAYLESRSFTEPAFIFVIMVIAASRPILDVSGALLLWVARKLPLRDAAAYYCAVIVCGPLLGSFITEPAAMTLSAMLLRRRYFGPHTSEAFRYGTLGVLFVNVSIGGTLTPFAAPPVLMVAERWGWDLAFMLQTFGWKAAIAVVCNAVGALVLFRAELDAVPEESASLERLEVPRTVVGVHLAFLIGVVATAHHPLVFIAIFLFFLGFTEAYRQHQSRLILREGLLVGFFLAGLVVLGGMQRWWLEPLLAALDDVTLYYGATVLTAFTDNAALTYLGSLVDGMEPDAKYALVAGAVTGGGLTVIANAPNPAGYSILKGSFPEGGIDPLRLAAAAAPPTLVAIMAFRLLP
ncbi:putative Na+/H+ antiporter [Rhodoplanes serenus]|uniref:putative Na+/H+ antiporter n=1 Tax=Rhodoplanes serenus TaxID=200615 RepID=UPI000DABDAD5|nr:putative Na+/H+ antiporter [Rhodoplanes serenus]RAI33016.1 hypothetical protein CH340_13630 [Rhodoplanes serenus]